MLAECENERPADASPPRGRRQAQAADGAGIEGALHAANAKAASCGRRAGLPHLFSPHSFRVTVVTDLLNQNVPLEDVQYLAGHSNPRTMQIYDRRRRVIRNIVERISI
jgi:integrase